MLLNLAKVLPRTGIAVVSRSHLGWNSVSAFTRFYAQGSDAERFQKPDVAAAMEKGEISLQDLYNLSIIDSKLKSNIKKLQYNDLTPVQSRGILPMLTENGVVCRAKTGTGKTMAFAIPVVQTCLDNIAKNGRQSKTQALIIAPTRDLAIQIKEEITKLVKPNRALAEKVLIHLNVGGKSDPRFGQIPSIVIATPGRLEANLRDPRFAQRFSELKYKVYDEADRLLDQGFEESLHNIDDMLEEVRQKSSDSSVTTKNVLFSATVDKRMDDFALETIGQNYTYINCVNADEPEAHENIHQTIVKTNDIYESHVAAISHIFRMREQDPKYKAILFIPTKVGTDFFFDIISQLNSRYPKFRRWAYKLNGDMSQNQRERNTDRFRKCPSGLLVCTDVAARGLDFKNVTDVIQLSPSLQVADYVHKVGRTARAGTSGNATLFLTHAEYKYKKILENERGILFSKEIQYETFEEDAEKFKELDLDPDVVTDYTKSSLGFYRSISGIYKLRQAEVLKDLVEMYRVLLNDPVAKLVLSDKLFLQLAPPDVLVPDYIESYSGVRRPQRSSNRNNGRGNYGRNNNSRNGYGRNNYGRDNYSQGNSYGNTRQQRFQSSNDGGNRFSDNSNRGNYSDNSRGFNNRGSNDRSSKRSFGNSDRNYR